MKAKNIMCLPGFWIIVLCLTLAVMPGKSQAEEENIRIGILGPLETPAGKGIRWAAEMAAEEINAQGGILEKQIKLFFSDSKYKPEIGAYGYAKLVRQDNVIAVIGSASSNVSLEVMEQMQRYKVPFLPTGAASPDITDKVARDYDKYKCLFRVCHSSLEMSAFTTDWLINGFAKTRNLKSTALMIENAVWTRPIAKKWEKSLREAGIEIPVFEYFDEKTRDFTPILSKIINSNAEAICVLSSHVAAAAYVNLWADMKGPIMAGITASSSTIWGSTRGKALSLIDMLYPGIIGLTSGDKQFCEKYVKKYETTPEYTSPYTYDAMYILKTAVEKAKSSESEAIVNTLENTDYNGVMGRWVFDKASHHPKFGPGYRQLMMVQWQLSGKLCVIWPERCKKL